MVDTEELALTPAYRPAELLETVPGLAVTLHSGEGEAGSTCCAATTWITARTWRPSSTRYPSTSRATRTARAVSVGVGTLGFERFLSTGWTALGTGNLLGALELQHYDGPWDTPRDQRKINAVVRYSEGNLQDGYSLTLSFYHDLWNAQADQPERALAEGLIPNRHGELDSSDRGVAQRTNLSYQRFAIVDGGADSSK